MQSEAKQRFWNTVTGWLLVFAGVRDYVLPGFLSMHRSSPSHVEVATEITFGVLFLEASREILKILATYISIRQC